MKDQRRSMKQSTRSSMTAKNGKTYVNTLLQDTHYVNGVRKKEQLIKEMLSITLKK